MQKKYLEKNLRKNLKAIYEPIFTKHEEFFSPTAEIAASLLEKEKAILGIVEEINELINN